MARGRWIWTGIIGVLGGGPTFQGLRPKPPPPVEVTTAVDRKGRVTRTVTAAGHLEAQQTVKVSSNVTGDLIELNVNEGDRVQRGQLLGQIDKRLEESQVAQFRGAVASAKAQIIQIEANVAQDKRDLERLQKLVAEKLASSSDLEKSQTPLQFDHDRLAPPPHLAPPNQAH